MDDTKKKDIKYMYTVRYVHEDSEDVEVALSNECEFEEVLLEEGEALGDSEETCDEKAKNPKKNKNNCIGKFQKRHRNIKKRKISLDNEEDSLNVKLIRAVFERQPLWNNTLSYEKRNFKVTSQLWTDVDTLLNLQSGEAHSKFKSLRDRFVRLVGEHKLNKENDSTTDNPPPLWKYYDLLKFLTPTIVYRTGHSNLKRKDQPSSSINKTLQSEVETYSKSFKSLIDDITSQHTHSAGKKSRVAEVMASTNSFSPFEMLCMKQLESLDKPSDNISAFCSYIDSELRTLSDEDVAKLKGNIVHLILETKKKN